MNSCARSTVRVPKPLAVASLLLVSPIPAQSQSDEEPRKSYVIPALEIIGFDALLNVFDRLVLGDP